VVRRFIGLIRDHRPRIGRIVARISRGSEHGCEGEGKDREGR